MNQAEVNASNEIYLYDRLHGRIALTVREDRLRCLERTYMTECQTLEFRQRWGAAYAAPAYHMQWIPASNEVKFQENIIDEKRMFKWLSMRTAIPVVKVEAILETISDIYTLRELMGIEDEPPVLNRNENRYEFERN